MRGNRAVRRVDLAVPGSIPACAGEPSRRSERACCRAVYPRVCGGTNRQQALHTDERGLSPRVRGNRGQRDHLRTGGGSIPACAGEPHNRWQTFLRLGVYPRVCGGTIPSGSLEYTISGLSPRVRGNRLRQTRVCSRGHFDFRGLSPRVRGNRVRRLPGLSETGSIPACAGEPERSGRRVRGRRVYPRVCGGTAGRLQSPVQCWGLSPRVRGNRASLAQSIPACAGEPVTSGESPSPLRVYPRVCGGTRAWFR